MDRIVLVQHCQSAHHLGRSAGTDSELTDLGRKQASCVAERIAAELDGAGCRLVSSDLRRAWQTAEIIGARVNARPVAESGLREWKGRAADAMSPQEQARAAADRRWFLFDWPCQGSSFRTDDTQGCGEYPLPWAEISCPVGAHARDKSLARKL